MTLVAREKSYLGSATDTSGEELCVFRTPAGNAVILGTGGTALMLSPAEAAKLTGHVDRAVMPGQQSTGAEGAPCRCGCPATAHMVTTRLGTRGICYRCEYGTCRRYEAATTEKATA